MSSINYADLGRDVFNCVGDLSNILHGEVMPLVNRENNTSELRECSYLLFTRVWCWVLSLHKLNAPTDYQPMASCARALLETTADITLLAHGGNIDSPEKMLAWPESARLKLARNLVDYFQEAGLPIPNECQDHQTFLQQNEQRIIQRRTSLWGRPQHPERWTGSGDLVADLRRIGLLQEPLIDRYLEMPLLQFYRARFPILSWSVHGSGFAVTRSAAHSTDGNDFYGYAATCHKFSIDLAIICTLSVLNLLGVSGEISDLERRLEQIRTRCLTAYSMFPS